MSARRPSWDVLGACAVTAVALLLLARFAVHAGGLWRDEAATARFATLPTWGEIFSRLHLDNFPLLSLGVFRTWSAIAGPSDASYRVLGFVVGAAVLAAFWGHAIGLRRGFAPWVGLVLFFSNPVCLRAVASIRPYGLGVAAIVAAHVLIGRATERPSAGRVAAGAAAAIASVQTLYQNAILLGAIALSASAVALLRGRRRAALVPLGIGAAAALSLLPYAGSIAKAQQWSVLNRGDVPLSHLISVCGSALAEAGPASIALWGIAAAGALVAAARAPRTDDRALYGAISLVAGPGAFLAFLHLVRMPTQAWYYVTPLAVAAVAIDTALPGLPRPAWTPASRAAAAALVLALSVRGAWAGTGLRQTNGDLIATKLRAVARPIDLVIVNPWYFAITLQRYGAGSAPLITVPPMDDATIHRYDLLKERMAQPAPIAPILERVEATLRNGGRVFAVGGLEVPPGGSPPPELPPAPAEPWGWSEGAYQTAWSQQLTAYLMAHAGDGRQIDIGLAAPVNPLERLPLYAFSGWRDSGAGR